MRIPDLYALSQAAPGKITLSLRLGKPKNRQRQANVQEGAAGYWYLMTILPPTARMEEMLRAGGEERSR